MGSLGARTEGIRLPHLPGMRRVLWCVTELSHVASHAEQHWPKRWWHCMLQSCPDHRAPLAGFISSLFVVMPTKFAVLFTFANIFAIARWAPADCLISWPTSLQLHCVQQPIHSVVDIASVAMASAYGSLTMRFYASAARCFCRGH